MIAADPAYRFLHDNPNLGSNIILLGYGGSHAYGLNNENSDIDLRGIAVRKKQDILTSQNFEQVVDIETDTTIYSFDKIVKLLCECNPNVIEMLGLREQDYIYLHPIGKELVKNRKLFLSKKAIHSFGGYANAQLRRLENKAASLVGQEQMEQHILKSIEHASVDFKRKYFEFDDDAIRLYTDRAVNPEFYSEVFMDVNLHHYPLRDYKDMFSEMANIVRCYAKIGRRNEKAIAHDKLGKHMCHLVRLYLMCFDILEKGEIITYRDEDHDFLMSIRNGEYLDENRQPIPEFYKLVDGYEKKLDDLKNKTKLPEYVDLDRINHFVADVNESIVSGTWEAHNFNAA